MFTIMNFFANICHLPYHWKWTKISWTNKQSYKQGQVETIGFIREDAVNIEWNIIKLQILIPQQLWSVSRLIIWIDHMWSIFGLFQKNIKYAICQQIKISTDWYPLLFLQNNCFLSTLNIILYYCSCRIIKQVSLRSTSTSKWSVLYSVLIFILVRKSIQLNNLEIYLSD